MPDNATPHLSDHETTALTSPTQNILITGATGFIGRHLVAALPAADSNVTALVRHSAAHLPGHVKPLVADLKNFNEQQTTLQGFDIVIHLAGANKSAQRPTPEETARLNQLNITATKGLARAAAKAGVRRFIFMSSAKVMGEVSAAPFTEQDTEAPKDEYARSKLAAERALEQIAADSEMELVIIRPPMVYGKGNVGNFHSLARLIGKGLPLPLSAIINQRSFCAVENLIDFTALCLTHPEAANETFFLSDGEDLSTPALIRLIAEANGKTPRLIPLPGFVLKGAATMLGRTRLAQSLVDNLQVDISKARRKLRWSPPLDPRSAIKKSFS